MKNTIIVDIDGTIAKVGDRLKYLQQEKKDWDAFYEHCDEDTVIYPIAKLVDHLSVDYEIVYCTGRRESVREKTIQWIDKHLDFAGSFAGELNLLMRKDKDWRHDTEVKPELLAKNGYTPDNVWFILEDRDSMVAKWRELGFTCLQVNDGKF
jgi:hypothetical protein